MVSFGCSGRNAEFGVVDMKAVESKAEIVKTVKEEVATKGKALQEEMTKEMEGKSQEEQKKKLLKIKRLKCSWYNQKRKIN